MRDVHRVVLLLLTHGMPREQLHEHALLGRVRHLKLLTPLLTPMLTPMLAKGTCQMRLPHPKKDAEKVATERGNGFKPDSPPSVADGGGSLLKTVFRFSATRSRHLWPAPCRWPRLAAGPRYNVLLRGHSRDAHSRDARVLRPGSPSSPIPSLFKILRAKRDVEGREGDSTLVCADRPHQKSMHVRAIGTILL